MVEKCDIAGIWRGDILRGTKGDIKAGAPCRIVGKFESGTIIVTFPQHEGSEFFVSGRDVEE